jgi:glycosyltransferase involved in cell wall biosynthesis
MKGEKMRITFVIDGFFRKPVGGAKIIYQYANHFCRRGHQVTIVFCMPRPAVRLEGRVPYNVRRIAAKCIVEQGPRWFPLEKNVRRIFTTAFSADTIPDGDAVFATAVETARPVAALPERKGKKFYLIQGLENWRYSDEAVYETYRLGMTNITIAEWLKNLVCEKSGRDAVCIPNGIDSSTFQVKVPNRERYPHSISMIYQNGKYKGFEYGYAVLLKLKERYPDMRCHIFGVSKRKPEWPKWIQYTSNASEKELVSIYNSASVFLCSSVEEGFGLCGAESMACGCAFATSGYRGVYTYARDGFNALISPVKDVDALYRDVSRLFDDAGLREFISKNGVESMQDFSLDKAFARMDSLMETV